MKKKITPEQFVEIWQKAKTVKQAAHQTSLTYSGVTNRARYYRLLGVSLKRHGGSRIDYSTLNTFAKKFEGKK